MASYLEGPGSWQMENFFLLVRHKRLMTNEAKVRRNIAQDDSCPRCNNQCETALHALRDCPWVKTICMQIVKSELWPQFFSLDLKDWIDWNIATEDIGRLTTNHLFNESLRSCWRWSLKSTR